MEQAPVLATVQQSIMRINLPSRCIHLGAALRASALEIVQTGRD
jgi:hypothetical protein